MTFVKGTTTWGALSTDLTKLICGDMADGSSTTVASGDRWVREVTRTVTDGVLNTTTTLTSATAAFTAADVGCTVNATGVPTGTTIASVTNSTTVVLSAAATATATGVSVQICLDTIRTPAAKDVATGAISNRTGYFSLLGAATMGATGQSTVCRVSNPFTSDPSTGGYHRWLVTVSVGTANTVAGNYSNAIIAIRSFDLDNDALVQSSSLNPTSGGVVTGLNGLQVTMSDPSGILPVNTVWVRGFTSTYMYGVDHWPFWYRASGSATFSVAPPGVSGTDYDIVQMAYPPNAHGAGSYGWPQDRGNLLHGLGIKTATGLGTGALYTVSWNMAMAKMRIFNSATAGYLNLDIGQAKQDALNSTSVIRNVGGLRMSSTWARMFTTPGSVLSTSLVQYWMSVKNDGIALVMYGDPGVTGKMGTAWFGAYTPTDTTYDVFPLTWGGAIWDYTADQTSNANNVTMQYPYWVLRRHQDGSEGTRDWQTKWMRCEHLYATATSGSYYLDAPLTTMQSLAAYTTAGDGNTYLPTRQNKPAPDGKWWLYGFQYAESAWGSGGTNVDENRFVRGSHTTRCLFVPETGWASGDELTDTVTGTKYLLILADYVSGGTGARLRTSASTYYGGLALAEL